MLPADKGVILEIKEEMIERETLIHDSIAQDKAEAGLLLVNQNPGR